LLHVDYHNLILDRLDKVSHEKEKTLGKIERDKLMVARVYNKRVKKKNYFKSQTLSGRRFCLLGLGATGSGSGRQSGKERIGSRK
jgi:hypothetical protein